jgi:hypothetical protein
MSIDFFRTFSIYPICTGAYAPDGGCLDGTFPFSLSAKAMLLLPQSNEKLLAHPPTLERVPVKYPGLWAAKAT